MPSEAQARITINKLLEAAGWCFTPDANGQVSVICEQRVTKKVYSPHEDLGADFDKVPGGFVDYVLLNTDDKPVAVVEAKKESIDPLTAKEQARSYAESLGVAHIFLSNGLVHYYWNLRQGNPVRVSRFLPLAELGKAAKWKPDAANLAAAVVDENYIAVSQDPKWLGYSPEERVLAMVNQKIRLLRDYQVAAAQALQQAAVNKGWRFLFEMATGTGKTLLSGAITKLFLRTNNATRVLFLVDRLELETQAWKHFNAYLGPDGIKTVIYKKQRDDWKSADVVVTTIQSLATRNRYLTDFAPTDFQLLISDEAHRTISGNHRAIFEYFVGAKLGLTATPRDYLKGVNEQELGQEDPRALEKRILLDTYHTFGCGDGKPTFRFSLLDAVRHAPPYLVNPVALDARTEITTAMLSKEGFAVKQAPDEDGNEAELIFTKRDYEKKFFSDETNLSFVRCFLDNAWRDPITDEVGKTILFAVSRRHAAKLVKLLNEEAMRRWPEAYGAGSSFAVQVTSDIPGAQQMTIDFANNNLNGKSRWKRDDFRDYNTSRTRVCVTVGMMTTGYDCEDVLNVALVRPIFSPTDFIQIKGRGTRLFTFKHEDGELEIEKPKAGFALFDFFANCEYFEKEFNYDKKLNLPKTGEGEGEGGGGAGSEDDFTNTNPDPIKNVLRETIGEDGMRVDREMYRERFAAQAKAAAESHAVLRQALESEDWTGVEEFVKKTLLDKPDDFWNLDKLREIYRTDREPTLREIIQVVFGLSPGIATREQLAAEEFERFLATENVDSTKVRELRQIFMALLLDNRVREDIEAGQFGKIMSVDMGVYQGLRLLGKTGIQQLMAYVDKHVRLSDFKKAA
ncbi:MAG TPA: restriction endonuclease subunit R [Verrucomicrobiales bacterium]|nr:restriction endonuclease subunit R [Verrucomicrobiales bacterium]HRJ10648.1 DEAD/DEAH box helicase family protein [Prosthecobacter sp.]HRK14960.1 DEAD/DEAH box helicase family protein [Prosthecobacter sp.]